MFQRALFYVTLMLAALPLEACGDQCSIEKVVTSFNKPGSIGVVLEKKDCGATTDYAYELKEVRPGGEGGELLLRFDSGHRAEWANSDHEILDVHWINDTQLNVVFRVPARVFDKIERADGITVQYRFRPGTSDI